MSSNERKILDISIAPQKLSQFRESLQGAFETCDAKAYAEYIAEDVRFFYMFRNSF
jgi:ketosteroid isomerase-like protein